MLRPNPALIARTLHRLSAGAPRPAGPCLEASQMDLEASPALHKHTWPTKQGTGTSPAPCISSAPHHTHLPPLRMSPHPHPSSPHPQNTPPSSETTTAKQSSKITSPAYPSTKNKTTTGASVASTSHSPQADASTAAWTSLGNGYGLRTLLLHDDTNVRGAVQSSRIHENGIMKLRYGIVHTDPGVGGCQICLFSGFTLIDFVFYIVLSC